MTRLRPRLLPLAMAAMAGLLVVRVATLHETAGPIQVIGPAAANQGSAPRAEPGRPAEPARGEQIRAEPARPPEPAPGDPSLAERALLEALRSRRAELDRREAALAEREMLLAAAERRLSGRIEELQALQARLDAENRARAEQNEQGMRQLVRLYEGMRPRDAAAIFDELDLAVLVPVVDRMREARAAPVLAAMRPERARLLTTELARYRARPAD